MGVIGREGGVLNRSCPLPVAARFFAEEGTPGRGSLPAEPGVASASAER